MAADRVVALAAVDDIVAFHRLEQVVARPALERVVAGVPEEVVRALAAVRPDRAGEVGLARARAEIVVAAEAVELELVAGGGDGDVGVFAVTPGERALVRDNGLPRLGARDDEAVGCVAEVDGELDLRRGLRREAGLERAAGEVEDEALDRPGGADDRDVIGVRRRCAGARHG